MKVLLLTLACLLVAAAASAQVVVDKATAKVDFTSTDHVATDPVSGVALLTSYQGSVFPIAADVSTGTPITVGPVIAKTLAVTNPTGTALRLTFAQLGIANGIPACTVAPCPVYSVVLVAIGPGGTTLRGINSESDSFTLAPPALPRAPAGPSTVRILP